jgi:hypothetical protein
MTEDEKPQYSEPDAPITNEELHLSLAGNMGRLELATVGLHYSLVAVAASLLGFAPPAYGVAVPAVFATVHMLHAFGFTVDSESRVRWLLNRFVSQKRSLRNIHESYHEQLSDRDTATDGGKEVTRDE